MLQVAGFQSVQNIKTVTTKLLYLDHNIFHKYYAWNIIFMEKELINTINNKLSMRLIINLGYIFQKYFRVMPDNNFYLANIS